MARRVGGIIFIKADGVQFDAKGSFEYNLGIPKRDAVMGSDAHHGFTEKPQEAYISGEITDRLDLDLVNSLLQLNDATVTLELANGKILTYPSAYYSGTGTGQTDEGNIEFRVTADGQAREITT